MMKKQVLIGIVLGMICLCENAISQPTGSLLEKIKSSSFFFPASKLFNLLP